MLMDNQAPSAPPPMQPVTPGNNPYQFITDPGKPPKKSLFSGSSQSRRIVLVAVLAGVGLAVIAIVVSLISAAGSSSRNDYQNLVQQQAEIIRISDIGTQKARGTNAKNLAVTSKLSLLSSQAALTSLAKGAGASTDPKVVNAGKDAATDTELTAAEQSNRFDEVFSAKLTELLNEYQQTLKRLYDQSSKPDSKATLQQAYNNAGLLMQNGKP